ncbi:DUF6923 family protein, partial [Planctomycetota bacterium]
MKTFRLLSGCIMFSLCLIMVAACGGGGGGGGGDISISSSGGGGVPGEDLVIWEGDDQIDDQPSPDDDEFVVLAFNMAAGDSRVRISEIQISATGNADESADILSAHLYVDTDGNGILSKSLYAIAQDQEVAPSETFTQNNGTITFSFTSKYYIQANSAVRFFVVYKLNGNADLGETFGVTLDSVHATSASNRRLNPTFPAGTIQTGDGNDASLSRVTANLLASEGVINPQDQSVINAAEDVCMLHLKLTSPLDFTAEIQSMTFTITYANGSQANDIKPGSVRLLLDNDNDGDGDSTLATGTILGSSITFDNLNHSILAGDVDSFLVTLDLNGTAVKPGSFLLRLAHHNDVLLSNPLCGVTDLPIKGGLLGINHIVNATIIVPNGINVSEDSGNQILDGLSSSDPDPTDWISAYSWSITNTPPIGVLLQNASTHTATLTIVEAQNSYTIDIQLHVISIDGSSDIDTVSINVEADNIDIMETDGATEVSEGGEIDTYSITLNSLPLADVLVSVITDAQSTVDKDILTFTTDNWDDPQFVTITAIDDDVAEDDHASIVNHIAESADENYDYTLEDLLTVNIIDNDSASIIITETDGSTFVTENAISDTYSVYLNSKPTDDVNILITTSTGQCSLDKNNLTFGEDNWNTPQIITVEAIDDDDVEGDHVDAISHQTQSIDSFYNGIAVQGITVNISDKVLETKIQFKTRLYTSYENGEEFSIQVELTTNRINELPEEITVELNVTNNSTLAENTDFMSFPKVVTFPQGAVNGDIHEIAVIPIEDTDIEGFEEMDIALSNPVGLEAALGNIKYTKVVMFDNDGELFGIDHGTLHCINPETSMLKRYTPCNLAELSSIQGLTLDPANNVFYGYSRGWLLKIDKTTGAATCIGPTSCGSLAYDPNSNTLYGSDTDDFFTIDTTTAVTTKIGDTGFSNIVDMAYDNINNILFAVNMGPVRLIRIDTSSGVGTEVAPTFPHQCYSLTYNSIINVLYAINQSNDELIQIDPSNAECTIIGETGISFIDCIAFDAENNSLYGIDKSTNDLLDIDISTGEVSEICGIGTNGINFRSLAYNENTDTLYGIDLNSGRLHIIDAETGISSPIGKTGLYSVQGLAYDPNNDILYGIDQSTDELITIDVSTGKGTVIGPLSFDVVRNLTFNPIDNILYGIDDGTIISINTTDGSCTAIGDPVAPQTYGLAFDRNNQK